MSTRQTFNVPKIDAPRHLAALRAAMQQAGLHALFIPHADEYQNEYQPAACQRLAFATGFTGSAGAALIFEHDAFVFVDGRYTLQAKDQLDPELFEVMDLVKPGPFDWLAQQTGRAGLTLGYDPKILTPNRLNRLNAGAETAKMHLCDKGGDVIDAAWISRPPLPASPIVAHPDHLTGYASADKRRDLAKELEKAGLDAVLCVAPASLAWLFNLRGNDVACTPIALGRAILHADGRAQIFLNSDSPKPDLAQHLGQDVSLRDLQILPEALSEFKGLRIGLDPDLASVWFFETLKAYGAKPVPFTDPCARPRACKTAIEIAGAKQAHLYDGIALVRFLHWLSERAPSDTLSEIDAVKRLEAFREDTGQLRDIAFETIAGSGPNGAIVHYRVNHASNRALQPGLFLVDSGGQYACGTTDVTRTIALGEPDADMRRLYTLVLKGHMALARVRFPEGTKGEALDALARHPLWQAGLDYDHGTGHGVGSYLGVHEGPQRIAKSHSDVPLQAGMIVSNEPGYYRAGAFGIRIENLQYVTEAAPIAKGDRLMLGFEILTLAPYDRRLIDSHMLDTDEREWVDAYHKRVLDHIQPHLDEESRQWLADACQPI